tara:strand:+ start:63 stop:293 length:231 start_codon:yes stop_codon:yes gene_type:complete
MKDMKRIKINVDQAKAEEMFKKTFRRYETGFEDDRLPAAQGHTPAEQKFLNKLTVGVCAVAALIVFAAYHLLPKIN